MRKPEIRKVIGLGGWRVFMRGAERELSAKLMVKDKGNGHEPPAFTLARAFVQAKHGEIEAARKAVDKIEAGFEKTPGDDIKIRQDLILVDAHVRVYEGQSASAAQAEQLGWVLDTLDPSDQIGQALALNQFCILSLHAGHFDKAQEYAESAIRHYRQGGAEFGSLHLLAHLGQIKLMRGDILGAEAQYRDMEDKLARLPGSAEALIAICRALRSEVAYEMNALSSSNELLADAFESIEEDDAWLDVRAAAYRVRIRLAYVNSGLPGALTDLAHCERMAERLNMPRLKRLMQLERVRALTLSDELDAARTVMRSIGMKPERHDWAEREEWVLRQGSSAVAIARWLVRARRAPEALAFIEPAEDFAIRGGQLLSLAKLRVIRSAAYWKLNQKTDATKALLSALRLLGRQPFRRFILDEGNPVQVVIQAALDGDFVTKSPSPDQRRCLAELAHAWTSETHGLDLKQTPGSTGASESPVFKDRYLQLLAHGMSNKEIGRTMGVSVNTVKYHLKQIFRELHVDNRTRAVAEAQRLGMISSNRPPDTLH